jgi:hypothetical protein
VDRTTARTTKVDANRRAYSDEIAAKIWVVPVSAAVLHSCLPCWLSTSRGWAINAARGQSAFCFPAVWWSLSTTAGISVAQPLLEYPIHWINGPGVSLRGVRCRRRRGERNSCNHCLPYSTNYSRISLFIDLICEENTRFYAFPFLLFVHSIPRHPLFQPPPSIEGNLVWSGVALRAIDVAGVANSTLSRSSFMSRLDWIYTASLKCKLN